MRAACAEAHGRPVRADARAVRRDQDVGARRRRFCPTTSATPAEPFSSPVSIMNLALKPRLPRLRKHGVERGHVDRVLALVVGRAAAVEAVAVARRPPGARPPASTDPRGRGSRRHGHSRGRSAGRDPRCGWRAGSARTPRPGSRRCASRTPSPRRPGPSRLPDSAGSAAGPSGVWLSEGMATRRAISSSNVPSSKYLVARATASARLGMG